MTTRPNIFDQKAFEACLRQQGCPESMVSPIVSDVRLFVPLAIRQLGVKGLFEVAESAREELGLGPQQEFWKETARHAVGWAEEQLEMYKMQKKIKGSFGV